MMKTINIDIMSITIKVFIKRMIYGQALLIKLNLTIKKIILQHNALIFFKIPKNNYKIILLQPEVCNFIFIVQVSILLRANNSI